MKILKNVAFAVIGFTFIAVASQIGKHIGHETANKVLKSTPSVSQNLPWFTNSYYGFKVETPFKLDKVETQVPEGNEEYINTMKTYFSEQGGRPIMVMYIESNYEAYDVELGLKGSIGNMIHSMNGSDLTLGFQKLENGREEIVCSGEFMLNQNQWILKGYCYWNGNGKILIVTGFGKDSQKSSAVLKRVVDSVTVTF